MASRVTEIEMTTTVIRNQGNIPWKMLYAYTGKETKQQKELLYQIIRISQGVKDEKDFREFFNTQYGQWKAFAFKAKTLVN
jgi:hypothetical protein